MGSNLPISALVQTEIEALHQFFADWFNGVLPKTEEAYAPVATALADDFLIVAPGGQTRERAALLQGLWDAHGSQTGMRIWIEAVQLRRVRGEIVWATYEEWQTIAGNTTGRISTVIFSRQPESEPTLKWEHVHETWLPGNLG